MNGGDFQAMGWSLLVKAQLESGWSDIEPYSLRYSSPAPALQYALITCICIYIYIYLIVLSVAVSAPQSPFWMILASSIPVLVAQTPQVCRLNHANA